MCSYIAIVMKVVAVYWAVPHPRVHMYTHLMGILLLLHAYYNVLYLLSVSVMQACMLMHVSKACTILVSLTYQIWQV